MIESTTIDKFSLVIMKVFLYDFGVCSIVHFPLFEVPLEPCLNEGRYCNKQIPLHLRILNVFTSCFVLLEERSPWKNDFSPWKVLYFFQKILYDPCLAWITEKGQKQVIENKGDEFCWKKLKPEKLIEAVRKWEMLLASKVKISSNEKTKVNMNSRNKIFGKHTDNSPIKIKCN